MTRQKVEFATNTPVALILASEGTLQPSQKGYGDEYRYFFEGDQVAWTKPELHAAIQAAGVHVGDEIVITRAERREGNRRRVEWQVEKIEDEPTAAADTAHSDARPALPPPPPVRDPRQRAADLEADKEAAANYAYYGAPIGAPPANGHSNGHQPAPPAPAAPPIAAELPVTPADAQAAMLCAAIDAAIAAEAYAASKGYPLRFSSDDVRTMANTMKMDARNGGR